MNPGAFDVQRFARGINELLVLSALRPGAKHGYQIAQEVETVSDGLFVLRFGTLYPMLARLEEDGLIDGAWSKGRGRRKEIYALTVSGRGQLTCDTKRLQEVVSRLMQLPPA